MTQTPFGSSGNKPTAVALPQLIFGTSLLGNIYQVIPYEEKRAIVQQYILQSKGVPVFDSAGKYGAGLALEALGQCLKDLNVKPEDVIISNKLAWLRTELKTDEPTFEPGVWRDLKHDAVQKISYDGILQCFEEGAALLNGYHQQLVSVHDPDEYLAKAKDAPHDGELYNDILQAYKALFELKAQGKVKAIGVGAKNWKTVKRLAADVPFDWVMIANSLTLQSHPKELLEFVADLNDRGVAVINSAVFNGGFLTGGDYYNYRLVSRNNASDAPLFQWRDAFFALCEDFSVKPAEACIQFALRVPGVKSIAVSTSAPDRVKKNFDAANVALPEAFWKAMKEAGLLKVDFI